MNKNNAKAMKSLVKVSHWKEGQAREVLECWEQSGLNLRQFSLEFGIGYKRLQYWKKRIMVSGDPVEFVEVIPVESKQPSRDDGMEIILSNHRRIRVSPAFDDWAVKRLIHIVED